MFWVTTASFITPTLITTIATGIGGLFLLLIRYWLAKPTERRDDRKELRDQVDALQNRMDALENEVTFWRNKFYEEQEETATLRVLMINNGLTPPEKNPTPPAA